MPNIILCCDYKKFLNQIFREEFAKELSEKNIQEDQFDLFQSTALMILCKQAPINKKHISKKHQSAFVTMEIRKSRTTHSRFLNNFHKEKTEENKNEYNKQINFCGSLVREIEKRFCYCITDIKTHWKFVKPYFSNKSSRSVIITLA